MTFRGGGGMNSPPAQYAGHFPRRVRAGRHGMRATREVAQTHLEGANTVEVEQELKDMPPSHMPTTGQWDQANTTEPRSLTALAEQWGLLGLVVGLFVAFGGADILGGLDTSVFSDVFTSMEVNDVAQSFQEIVREGDQLSNEVTIDFEAVSASMGAVALGAVATEQEVVEEAGEAAASLEAAEGPQLTAGLMAAGEVAWAQAQRLVFAGALAALGGYAGLLVDALKEPVRRRKRVGYLAPGDFTPGTIQSQPDQNSMYVHRGGTKWPDDRPMSALQLAVEHFKLEWDQLLRAARVSAAVPRRHVPGFVPSLVLSNKAVLDREHARPEVPTPQAVRAAYDVLCWFIDVVFEDRPIQRFWFLEMVARMPYFAYESVLVLYETLGWWRSPELRMVHAAEEDNEFHHLCIMESLGGDQRWLDRFFAQHGAVAYYFILILFFIIDPRWSYNFSRLIESHAVDTYGEFVDANAERLKTIPPPPIAVEYYLTGTLYNFDKFQTEQKKAGELRRPPCYTLYDVFSNIRDDEEQHVLTMQACEAWVAGGEAPVPLGIYKLSQEDYEREVSRDPVGRAAWVAWGEEVSRAAREAGRKRGASD